MIIQVENAVSDDDCRRLMTIYDRHVRLTKVKDQTGHPVVYSAQFRDTPDAAEMVPRLVERCLCSIRHQLQLTDPLYPETVILAALGPGGHHSRHADNCRQNEQGDWVANHTPQRDVSAIYYLNDTFEGGEIVFDQVPLMSSRGAGFFWPFPATAPMYTKSFRCAAASDTRWRFGSRSSNATHWQIFSLACRPKGQRFGLPDESRRPHPLIDAPTPLGSLCDYRRRRATNNPRPLSKICAVLGSGAGVTAAAVIVIVSTKKPHRSQQHSAS